MQRLNLVHRFISSYLDIAGAVLLTGLWMVSSPAAAQVSTQVQAPSAASTQEGDNPLGLVIHHVTMGVADIEKQRNFYHDVLGFSVGLFRNRPQFDHQQMHIPGFRLDMIGQKGSTRPTPVMGNDKQGWLHIDFATQDADAIYHRLKDKGVQVAPGRMEGNKVASFKVTDPEGNQIEITQP